MSCGPKIAAAVVFMAIVTAYIVAGWFLKWLGRGR